MTESTETTEAPNWLSELENKREKRLKARLGHEAGAGAPCIKCNEKCPGLDLHFWRKICKNCKCSKEDHDVHDDDIYGWAQFQLLGSKPNKIKKKIVLPGKKDEVELEWAPKGNTETIDQYLKTLAPESLPVKGSQAAQERKQLLQKQIPIHDIDPSLCDDLTDSELAKFQDYIKHMKNSAGVGQIIQFSMHYGNKHNTGAANSKVVSDRYPKGVPTMETVQLLGEGRAATLAKQLDRLAVQDQKELDAFFDKIPKPHNMTANNEMLDYYNLSGKISHVQGRPLEMGQTVGYHSPSSIAHSEQYGKFHPQNVEVNKNKNFTNALEAGYFTNSPPHGMYRPQTTHGQTQTVNEMNQNENLGCHNGQSPHLNQKAVYNEMNQNHPSTVAQGLSSDLPTSLEHIHPQLLTKQPGYNIHGEINKNHPLDTSLNLDHDTPPSLEHLPPPPSLSQLSEITNANPAMLFAREHLITEEAMPNYKVGPQEYSNEINRNANILPRYAPGAIHFQGDQQNPTPIGNVRDVIGNVHNVIGSFDVANSNYKPLQAFSPNQLPVSENYVLPNSVKIGAIRDITYEPEINTAMQAENPLYEGATTGGSVPADVEVQSKQCHKCSKFFKEGEFAIFVEKTKAFYHSECFRCAGCNQNLADLFYFYDKETDNVYCGRDFAKIRGIPRCKACDELIFVKEYCLAENSNYHLKHFCCFECDQALAGQNYVVEDSQPVCLPCFEKLKANKCVSCGEVIKPDEPGLALAEGIHFHATDKCFCCSVCTKVLHGAKLLFRNKKLYCSRDCLKSEK